VSVAAALALAAGGACGRLEYAPRGEAGCVAPRVACASGCCAIGERCTSGVCAAAAPTCATSDDCASDARCEGGVCVAWAGSSPGYDPTCAAAPSPGELVGEAQCRWEGPSPGDPFPLHVHSLATTVIVDLDLDGDPSTLSPSIVTSFFSTAEGHTGPGVVRVIDGATCATQFTMPDPADATTPSASPAVGDLDGDGRAEIVAVADGGGLLAFAWDPSTRAFVRRWRSAVCSGGTRTPDTTGGATRWSGPSIHDLDDDGSPEVIYSSAVFGSDGCIRDASLPQPATGQGVVPVIADVDEDGRMELVQGTSIHEWSGGRWVAEPSFPSSAPLDEQIALAELGAFPLSGGADRVEVVAVSRGAIRVQTIEGTTVLGPVTIAGGGGGSPVVADFDGDGRPEIGAAGSTTYMVVDLDCQGAPDPARCASLRTDGILWTQPISDVASGAAGSAAFDFDADGRAEVVYGDICFLRVFDGTTGALRFSISRSGSTAYDYPVIADVDGDGHAEIVATMTAGARCDPSDPLRPSIPFVDESGVLVLRGVMDLWPRARPVWSQHAYASTHVGDRGEIPRTSAITPSWRAPATNAFRHNASGALPPFGVPDATVGAVADRLRVPCDASGRATLRARLCNRGTLALEPGVEVELREGAIDGAVLCVATSAVAVAIGTCVELTCDATLPLDAAIDVHLRADPRGVIAECREGNDTGVQPDVACDSVD
jgi:hypothetical protein